MSEREPETAQPGSDRQGAPSALAGLRVVVLGDDVAPAFAARWLAAFGAEVTAVEPPGGHWLRRYSPTGATSDGTNGPLASFLHVGTSNVNLDPSRPGDRARLRALLADADILLHDLLPAGLARWDLAADVLRSEQPSLVQVALTSFGADGPYAGFQATSIVLLALGGYQFLTGEPGREPLMLPGFQPEYLTGFYGIIAALAATVRRGSDGQGCAAEVAAMDALASLHQFTTSQWLYQQSIRTRHGNRWENLYPITMLPCCNGYVALSTPGQDTWERLCAMIGRVDLLDDHRFTTPALRHQNADALDEILVGWMKEWEMGPLFHTAQEQWRIPLNPYSEIDDVLADPQYEARGFWVRPDDDPSDLVHPGLPVIMSETPWRVGPPLTPGPAPRIARGAGGGSRPFADRDSRLPLAGLSVLDFTRVWSGPLCTRILADLGARVIKIEAPYPRNAPAGGGPLSGGGRPTAGMGKLSRNKLSVAIDLRLPAGRELVKRLAAASDVLVENFSARVMPNFGLSYDVLRELNPGLVMLSMSGYGTTGPYRDYLCYGSATESMTGMTALLGYPGGEPLNSAIAYPDAVAGLAGAASVLTALVYRERTGRGQFLDLSQIEPATAMWGEYFLDFQMTGRRPARAGNEHAGWAPHGTYRCAGEDEWVSLAIRSDDEWRRFRDLVGLSEDDTYATTAGRREHRCRLDEAIAAWTADKDKFDVMQRLQRAGIPAGAVLNARELVEDSHLAYRGFFVDATAPEGGSFPMPGTPITVDGRRRDEWHAAPIRGEHNREVLRELLGMSDAEIDALVADGVLDRPASDN